MFYVFIFVGAGCGALSRYFLQAVFIRIYPSLPVGTLVANLIGCFLMGLLFPWLNTLPKPIKIGIITGFLGALTTLSSFSYEVNLLAFEKNWLGVSLIVVGTVMGGLALTWLGLKLAQILG